MACPLHWSLTQRLLRNQRASDLVLETARLHLPARPSVSLSASATAFHWAAEATVSGEAGPQRGRDGTKPNHLPTPREELREHRAGDDGAARRRTATWDTGRRPQESGEPWKSAKFTAHAVKSPTWRKERGRSSRNRQSSSVSAVSVFVRFKDHGRIENENFSAF